MVRGSFLSTIVMAKFLREAVDYAYQIRTSIYGDESNSKAILGGFLRGRKLQQFGVDFHLLPGC